MRLLFEDDPRVIHVRSRVIRMGFHAIHAIHSCKRRSPEPNQAGWEYPLYNIIKEEGVCSPGPDRGSFLEIYTDHMPSRLLHTSTPRLLLLRPIGICFDKLVKRLFLKGWIQST